MTDANHVASVGTDAASLASISIVSTSTAAAAGSVDWAHLERLMRFYDRYNPALTTQAPRILAAYKGREEQLFASLVKRYGAEPSATASAAPQPATSSPPLSSGASELNGTDSASGAGGLTSRLPSERRPPLTGGGRSTSLLPPSVPTPDLPRAGSQPESGAIASEPALLVNNHRRIPAAGAAVDGTGTESGRGRSDLDANATPTDEHADDSAQPHSTPIGADVLPPLEHNLLGDPDARARLIRYYRHYNPSKLASLDEILAQFSSATTLFAELKAIYGPEPQPPAVARSDSGESRNLPHHNPGPTQRHQGINRRGTSDVNLGGATSSLRARSPSTTNSQSSTSEKPVVMPTPVAAAPPPPPLPQPTRVGLTGMVAEAKRGIRTVEATDTSTGDALLDAELAVNSNRLSSTLLFTAPPSAAQLAKSKRAMSSNATGARAVGAEAGGAKRFANYRWSDEDTTPATSASASDADTADHPDGPGAKIRSPAHIRSMFESSGGNQPAAAAVDLVHVSVPKRSAMAGAVSQGAAVQVKFNHVNAPASHDTTTRGREPTHKQRSASGFSVSHTNQRPEHPPGPRAFSSGGTSGRRSGSGTALPTQASASSDRNDCKLQRGRTEEGLPPLLSEALAAMTTEERVATLEEEVVALMKELHEANQKAAQARSQFEHQVRVNRRLAGKQGVRDSLTGPQTPKPPSAKQLWSATKEGTNGDSSGGAIVKHDPSTPASLPSIQQLQRQLDHTAKILSLREHQNRTLRLQVQQYADELQQKLTVIEGSRNDVDLLTRALDDKLKQNAALTLERSYSYAYGGASAAPPGRHEDHSYQQPAPSTAAAIESIRMQFEEHYAQRKARDDAEMAAYFKSASAQVAHRDRIISLMGRALTRVLTRSSSDSTSVRARESAASTDASASPDEEPDGEGDRFVVRLDTDTPGQSPRRITSPRGGIAPSTAESAVELLRRVLGLDVAESSADDPSLAAERVAETAAELSDEAEDSRRLADALRRREDDASLLYSYLQPDRRADAAAILHRVVFPSDVGCELPVAERAHLQCFLHQDQNDEAGEVDERQSFAEHISARRQHLSLTQESDSDDAAQTQGSKPHLGHVRRPRRQPEVRSTRAGSRPGAVASRRVLSGSNTAGAAAVLEDDQLRTLRRRHTADFWMSQYMRARDALLATRHQRLQLALYAAQLERRLEQQEREFAVLATTAADESLLHRIDSTAPDLAASATVGVDPRTCRVSPSKVVFALPDAAAFSVPPSPIRQLSPLSQRPIAEQPRLSAVPANATPQQAPLARRLATPASEVPPEIPAASHGERGGFGVAARVSADSHVVGIGSHDRVVVSDHDEAEGARGRYSSTKHQLSGVMQAAPQPPYTIRGSAGVGGPATLPLSKPLRAAATPLPSSVASRSVSFVGPSASLHIDALADEADEWDESQLRFAALRSASHGSPARSATTTTAGGVSLRDTAIETLPPPPPPMTRPLAGADARFSNPSLIPRLNVTAPTATHSSVLAARDATTSTTPHGLGAATPNMMLPQAGQVSVWSLLYGPDRGLAEAAEPVMGGRL